MHKRLLGGLLIYVLGLAAAVIFVACDDKTENPGGDAGDLVDLTIVVLRNNTDFRVADAQIVIDNNSNLSCLTSGPGDMAGGSCEFRLMNDWHQITISKVGYRTLDTTFLVTTTMAIKYFTIFNY